MGELLLVAKPLVVGFTAVFFGISDNGISVLNTDGIVQSADRSAATPEVAELPFCIQGSGVPNDMIMDVGFINMSADNESVSAFCEAFGQLTSQTICFLRCDLTGAEGLPQVVANYIIITLGSSGLA